MNTKSQKICVWSGALFSIFFGIGLILAGFFPPTPPIFNADQIAQLYGENLNVKRLGFLFIQTSAALTAPFVAVISVQLKRIEEKHSPWTYTQLITGGCGVLILLLPGTIWLTAAFRPERSAEDVLLLNDLGWLLLTPTFACLCVQVTAIAMATFSDHRKHPILPRWYGYLNIWIAVLSLPAGLIVFFNSGPFSLNGIISFWMIAFIFFSWLIITMVVLLKAIDRQALENNSNSIASCQLDGS